MKIFLLTVLSSSLAASQVKLEAPAEIQPKLVNAKLEARAVTDLSATIDEAVRSSAPLWIGYSVPIIAKKRFICCFDSSRSYWRDQGCCTGCQLEGRNQNLFHSDGGSCAQDEPPTHALVMLRAAQGGVSKIRTFTPDCGLDAGGLRILWLTGVTSRQSLGLLKRYVSAAEEKNKLAGQAIEAIALHRDREADKILESLLAQDRAGWLREDAAFWLGSQRDREGYLALQRIVRSDPDEKFREHATFVISEAGQPESFPELVRMAKEDRSPKVRGQALFWLAEKASRQAESAITGVIENDPDRELKKQAVFALSQMPKEQGVPLLIKYARTHKDAKVRKEAIFWLGESEDPRALAFLEELLLSKN